MANGDAAAAAGLATFPATQDIRLGYDNDNIRGDELAAHITTGTHPASAIVSGVLDAARIPNLDSSKISTGGFDASRITSGAFTADRIPNLDASKITSGSLSVPGSLRGTSITVNNGVGGSSVVLSQNGNVAVGGTLNVSNGFGLTGNIFAATTYNQTNTGRALFVAADGLFGVGSSSLRYKKNVKDANLDLEAIRAIAVRTFQYRADFSRDDSVQIGVIAEELVELGLEQFVFFDENGQPDGVAYEKLALALLPLVQDQANRLDAIESRLNELEKN